MLQMVDAIKHLMGCDDVEPDIRNESSGEIPDQYLSADRARAVLGWAPRCTLDAGLRETIEWYRRLDSANPSGDSR